MYTSILTFAEDLPRFAAAHENALVGHDALFFLQMQDGPERYIRLEGGKVTVCETVEKAPDCTVIAAEAVMLDIINGKLNPALAILTGKVRIKGDKTKLMTLLKML